MSAATATFPSQREPELLGQTVVVIGGSAGIGLETARRARAEGPGDPYWPESRAPRARRQRARSAEHRGLRRHGLRFPRTILP
jgi:NAD(P)-dependent dehydrogenase (short-subunit alcohol dehydrogenase family)